MNVARKVVFSRTLRTAEWANTTIAAGDTTEELDKLRRGGEGHIVVWGGVGFWRSLMRLDLIDEFRLACTPTLRARVPGCSTTSGSPTGSTWSPAGSSATGPSGCATAGTAKPAARLARRVAITSAGAAVIHRQVGQGSRQRASRYGRAAWALPVLSNLPAMPAHFDTSGRLFGWLSYWPIRPSIRSRNRST
ncbi:MAG: dihydrofolate reductase family protein [Acidimicrobiia bacterium]